MIFLVFFFFFLVLSAALSNEQWQPHLGGGGVKKTKINAERPQPVARGHSGLSGGRRTNRPVCGVTPAAGWLPVNGQIISFKR